MWLTPHNNCVTKYLVHIFSASRLSPRWLRSEFSHALAYPAPLLLPSAQPNGSTKGCDSSSCFASSGSSTKLMKTMRCATAHPIASGKERLQRRGPQKDKDCFVARSIFSRHFPNTNRLPSSSLLPSSSQAHQTPRFSLVKISSSRV